MKINLTEAHRRTIDENLTILDLFDGRGFPFDFVVAQLSGPHPTVINRVSDRVYYILNGTARVTVGANTYSATKDDLMIIPRNTPHSIVGEATYIIITSPPFDPKNEEVL